MKAHTISSKLAPVSVAVLLSLSGQAISQEANTGNDESEVETIVVKGMKASVTKSLAIKRFENGVVDAISSEDIGSLPDENIAESIQRITGVQIERDEGRGALVSLRGLGPAYVGTTINGNTFASANFSGGFRFDIVQSELASDITVYKSPKASLQEDYLSGTINIGTAKPLSFTEERTLLKVEGNYTDVRSNTTPGFSFTHIGQSEDKNFGYLVNFGYRELDSRYDLMFAQRFAEGELINGVNQTDSGIPVERVDRPRYRREDTDTKRYLVNAAAQYIVSDDVEINVNAVYAGDNRDKYLQQLVPLINTGTVSYIDSTDNTWDIIGVENLEVEGNHTREMDERTSYAITSIIDWTATPDLALQGTVHYTKGEIDYTSHSTLLALRTNMYFDMSPNEPTFISGRSTYADNGMSFNPLDDPSTWDRANLTKQRAGAELKPTENNEIAFKLDAIYDLNLSGFTTLKAGVSYRNQGFANSQTNHYIPSEYLENNIIAGMPELSAKYKVVDDFTNGKYPGMDLGFLLADIYSLYSGLCYEGTCGNIMAFPTREIPSAFFELERDIFSLYTEVDFEFGNLKGDVGIRYTSTDRDTRFNGASIDYSMSPLDRGNPENNGGIESNLKQSANYNYSNFLPSLNLAYDITDELVLKAGIGKVLKRPGADGGTSAFARSIGFNSDTGIYRIIEGDVFKKATTGTIKNLSLEWYFNPSSAVSAAIFENEYENQTVQEDACLAGFSSPDENVYDAFYDSSSNSCIDSDGYAYEILRKRDTRGVTTYQGFELGYNQTFDFLPEPFNGLGVIANYTHIEADNGQDKLALTSLSKETYNLIGFYENDGFSARVTLNHRSPFVMNDGFFWGNNSFLGTNPGKLEKARHQIDLSFGYDINENIKVSFDALNINNDSERGTRFESARLQSFSTFGRTFIAKIQYSL